MRKALQGKLEKHQVGLSYLTSGIYMRNYADFIIMTKEQREQGVELLDPKELASVVSAKLLDRQTCVSLREFVTKQEWDAYADFALETKEPTIYKELV